MPGVASPPVNLTCCALLFMALPMRSTFMSLTSPYRSRGCLLSWCPQAVSRHTLANAGHSHMKWKNTSYSSQQNQQICSEILPVILWWGNWGNCALLWPAKPGQGLDNPGDALDALPDMLRGESISFSTCHKTGPLSLFCQCSLS